MNKLPNNWLTEGLLDFEYKKYLLMAYLKSATVSFKENKLYPVLADLIQHYNNLRHLKKSQEEIVSGLPKRLTKIDLENFTLEFEKEMDEEDQFEVVAEIIDYALPKIKVQLEEGTEIYEYIENNMEIHPIGLLPLNKEFGYMLLKSKAVNQTLVYTYSVSIFEKFKEKFRGIKTDYYTCYSNTPFFTFESIKLDLIRKNKTLPNPATWLIETKNTYPLAETMLPIAKRSLIRYLAKFHD